MRTSEAQSRREARLDGWMKVQHHDSATSIPKRLRDRDQLQDSKGVEAKKPRKVQVRFVILPMPIVYPLTDYYLLTNFVEYLISNSLRYTT